MSCSQPIYQVASVVNAIPINTSPCGGPDFNFNDILVSPNVPYLSSQFLQYEDLNYNAEMRNKMVHSFYKKATEKWYDYLITDVNDYLIISDTKVVQLIPSLDKLSKGSSKNDSDEDKLMKKKFIKRYFITPKFIAIILEEFTANAKVNWYDLPQYSSYVKKFIHHRLKKKIKNTINKDMHVY